MLENRKVDAILRRYITLTKFYVQYTRTYDNGGQLIEFFQNSS